MLSLSLYLTPKIQRLRQKSKSESQLIRTPSAKGMASKELYVLETGKDKATSQLFPNPRAYALAITHKVQKTQSDVKPTDVAVKLILRTQPSLLLLMKLEKNAK